MVTAVWRYGGGTRCIELEYVLSQADAASLCVAAACKLNQLPHAHQSLRNWGTWARLKILFEHQAGPWSPSMTCRMKNRVVASPWIPFSEPSAKVREATSPAPAHIQCVRILLRECQLKLVGCCSAASETRVWGLVTSDSVRIQHPCANNTSWTVELPAVLLHWVMPLPFLPGSPCSL